MLLHASLSSSSFIFIFAYKGGGRELDAWLILRLVLWKRMKKDEYIQSHLILEILVKLLY